MNSTRLFSTELWESIAGLRAEIDALPFLTALEDGTLDPELFRHYLAQDAHYLATYSRVLSNAAGRADRAGLADEAAFWAASAASALDTERELHAAHVSDFTAVAPSPACTAYLSYLLELAGTGYPDVVAGVLPCFWIYEDVGRRLAERVGDLDGHRYADWIGTYGDAGFAAATDRARAILDRVATDATADDRERMRRAFTTASAHEWSFWDAAWRHTPAPTPTPMP